jgi:hypothetical protein
MSHPVARARVHAFRTGPQKVGRAQGEPSQSRNVQHETDFNLVEASQIARRSAQGGVAKASLVSRIGTRRAENRRHHGGGRRRRSRRGNRIRPKRLRCRAAVAGSRPPGTGRFGTEAVRRAGSADTHRCSRRGGGRDGGRAGRNRTRPDRCLGERGDGHRVRAGAQTHARRVPTGNRRNLSRSGPRDDGRPEAHEASESRLHRLRRFGAGLSLGAPAGDLLWGEVRDPGVPRRAALGTLSRQDQGHRDRGRPTRCENAAIRLGAQQDGGQSPAGSADLPAGGSGARDLLRRVPPAAPDLARLPDGQGHPGDPRRARSHRSLPGEVRLQWPAYRHPVGSRRAGKPVRTGQGRLRLAWPVRQSLASDRQLGDVHRPAPRRHGVSSRRGPWPLSPPWQAGSRGATAIVSHSSRSHRRLGRLRSKTGSS